MAAVVVGLIKVLVVFTYGAAGAVVCQGTDVAGRDDRFAAKGVDDNKLVGSTVMELHLLERLLVSCFLSITLGVPHMGQRCR